MTERWTAHLLTWQLLSPLHSGAGKLSNLQRTRTYVPARALWAAMAARLAREFEFDYAAARDRVSANVRPTCLFPALRSSDASDLGHALPGADDYRLFPPPWDDRDSYLFLDGYVSTPVSPSSGGAVDGGLHEVEYIRPRTRPFADRPLGAPVFLLGYMLARTNADIAWQALCADSQVGGERRYGWGRIRLAGSVEPVNEVFGIGTGDRDEWPPVLRCDPSDPLLGQPLLGQLEVTGDVDSLSPAGLEGTVEPMLGRDTITGSFGGLVRNFGAGWSPGATARSALDIEISEQGAWRARPRSNVPHPHA